MIMNERRNFEIVEYKPKCNSTPKSSINAQKISKSLPKLVNPF